MKLTNYALLKESLKSAKEKYLNTDEISQFYFDELVEMDFTKTKKYVEWLCKVFTTDAETFSDMGTKEIINLLHQFDKAIKTKYTLPYKDVNAYKTIESLYTTLKDFDAYLDNRRMAKKHKGAEKIYENDKCTLYYITTREACQLYGAHTHWCITERNYNYWEEYEEKNMFFFLMDKYNPKEKYAFAIPLNKSHIQTFDVNDVTVDTIEVLNKYSIPPSTFDDLIENKFKNMAKTFLKDIISNKTITPVEINGKTYYNINSEITNKKLGLLVKNRKFVIKFNKCNTNFNCSNIHLDSLEGTPREVNGYFNCVKCKLKSLKGSPEIVNGNFECSKNPIRSLKGGPKKVTVGYYCVETNITNLVGLPKECGTPDAKFNLVAQNCKFLKSLEGCPEEIFGQCIFSYNPSLKVLTGGPKIMHGNYDVSYCKNLSSLKGAPTVMKPTKDAYYSSNFDCSGTNIKNLVGLPDTSECKYSLNIAHLELTSLEGLPTKVRNSTDSGKMEIYYYHTTVNDKKFIDALENDYPELKNLYLSRY